MTTVNEIKAALLDEWLLLQMLKSTITSSAGTYHDTATGRFTNKPGGAAGGGRRGGEGGGQSKSGTNTAGDAGKKVRLLDDMQDFGHEAGSISGTFNGKRAKITAMPNRMPGETSSGRLKKMAKVPAGHYMFNVGDKTVVVPMSDVDIKTPKGLKVDTDDNFGAGVKIKFKKDLSSYPEPKYTRAYMEEQKYWGG